MYFIGKKTANEILIYYYGVIKISINGGKPDEFVPKQNIEIQVLEQLICWKFYPDIKYKKTIVFSFVIVKISQSKSLEREFIVKV